VAIPGTIKLDKTLPTGSDKQNHVNRTMISRTMQNTLYLVHHASPPGTAVWRAVETFVLSYFYFFTNRPAVCRNSANRLPLFL